MSSRERKARLKRVTKALDMLRETELARQASANARGAAASSAASALDAIELETSPAWALFPQNWLNYRSKLDQEMTDHTAEANLAAAEALRIEKASVRFSELVEKLDAAQLVKQAAQEILDFISISAASDKSALGKIAKLDMISRKK